MNRKTAEKAAVIMSAIDEVEKAMESLKLIRDEEKVNQSITIRLEASDVRRVQFKLPCVDGLLEGALVAPIDTGLEVYKSDLEKALKALK